MTTSIRTPRSLSEEPMMTADQLTNLLDLAKAATPGPYANHDDGYVYSTTRTDNESESSQVGAGYAGFVIGESMSPPNREYLAALSPEVAIALIERIRELETAIRGEGWCPCDGCKPSGLRPWARDLLEPRETTPGAIIDDEFDEVSP